MAHTVYLIRHCQAEGQAPEAALTADGEAQAEELADFLIDKNINRIVSSPYTRAMKTIAPLADRLQLPLETDLRLTERVLAEGNLPDWMERLEASFVDPELKLSGGESGREAMERGVSAIKEILADEETTAVVTHGNLLSLILHHYDDRFGFKEWKALSNPDVYVLTVGDEAVVSCIWSPASNK